MRDMIVRLSTQAIERGLLPDAAVRAGIRRLCRDRLRAERKSNCEQQLTAHEQFVAHMDTGPIAPVPERANEQHYELPPEFFELVLGKHRKYSSCYFPTPFASLDEAEAAALQRTAQRAELHDGMRILELGCGWGSLSLWMAEHYPLASIVAVSNSAAQREYILARAAERGLPNLRVITADMNAFETSERFDRVVSVEMFEHMRNYRLLLSRVASWLRPGGKLFMHIFVHRELAYEFREEGEDDWMGRYFFSGGIMPSDDLPLVFQDDLNVRRRWRWNGTHYARTADAWLANLDAHRERVMPILERTYGKRDAGVWFQRWRVFFMACSELFGYASGEQWWVAHYLFEKQPQSLSMAAE